MFAKGTWLKNAVVAVFVGLLISATATVFFESRQGEQREQRLVLTQAAENVADDLETNMLSYISTLTAIDRFVVASKSISFQEFELFTREFLDIYPGIYGLSWNNKVRGVELDSFEASIKAQGFKNYQVTERTGPGKISPVSQRDVYFPVTYMAPLETNRKALGHDTYAPDKVTGNIRQKVLDKARDEKKSITTGRISLVQLENQYGLLIYHPVYAATLSGDSRESRREHLRGYSAGVFVVAEVLRPVAQLAKKSGFAISVRDTSMPAESQFLYDSRTADNKEAVKPIDVSADVFQTSVQLDVAGHRWEIEFVQIESTQASPPWVILFLGIPASLLLGAILWLLLSRADWFELPASKSRAPDYFLPVVVLTGVLVSVFTFWVFKDLEQKEIDQLALADAKSQYKVIHNSVSNNLDLMDSIASFHNESGEISQEAFRAFVSPLLKKRRGTQTVEWVPRITKGQLTAFEDQVATSGLSDFRVTEIRDGERVSVGSRAEYFPVLHVEPLQQNRSAIGLDLGFDERRLSALMASRDSGTALATGNISVGLQTDQPPRIWVFNPIYSDVSRHSSVQDRQDHLVGFVVIVLDVEEMLVQTLGDDYNKMLIRVEDISVPGGVTDIFNADPEAVKNEGGIEYVELLDFAGRQWKVTIAPRLSAYASERSFLPWLVLGSGLFATGLIGLIVMQLKYRHLLVEKLVDQRTAELDENQAFRKLIISTIPDLVFVVDKSLEVIEANPMFRKLRLSNLPQEGLIKEEAKKEIAFRQLEIFRQKNQQAFEQGETEVDAKVVFPDGEVHTLFTRRVRFTDNSGNDFVLGVARDVTEREEALRLLTRSNEELDEFAYIASHDLKEPLRGISNHAAMFLRNAAGTLDEDGTRRLDRIVHLTQHMGSLLDDLLYFSRVGRTDIAIQETNLHELVTEIVAGIAMADEPDVTVNILDSLPVMLCDRVRMGEVFRNLIVNGLKYNNSADKVINVGAEVKIVNGVKQTVVFVADNGIGINEEFHTEIFRIFKRLHKKDAYGGGTGSGLTFVKKIIDRHTGEVWVESSKGHGSTFYFYVRSKA